MKRERIPRKLKKKLKPIITYSPIIKPAQFKYIRKQLKKMFPENY